jgi:hypothetical protein
MKKLDTLLTHYIENTIEYIPQIVTALFILALGFEQSKNLRTKF